MYKGRENMHYHFFDYKYNIENFTSDMFSIPHLVFIAFTFVCMPIIFFFLRKVKHKGIDIFLKVFSILFLVFEITKITWESIWDIKTGHGFNMEGLLPIFTCSLFIYTMLGAAWGKGKVKDYSLSFITTTGLISGAIGLVYCRGLTFYPFWTFGGFYSLLFHFSMVCVGLFLLMTKYKKLEWMDIIRAWFPLVILSFISTPINYEYGADYMQTYSAKGVPLLSKLADVMAAHNLRYLFTVIMLVLYIPLGGIVVCCAKLIYLIVDKVRAKKNKPEQLAEENNSTDGGDDVASPEPEIQTEVENKPETEKELINQPEETRPKIEFGDEKPAKKTTAKAKTDSEKEKSKAKKQSEKTKTTTTKKTNTSKTKKSTKKDTKE